MKKNTFICCAFAATALMMTVASCNKNQETADETVAETETDTPSTGLRLAYVEIDTLMSQYNFCKDYTLLMNKKGENIRATLAAKERALQNQAMDLQKKYESNAFTTRDQLENAQRRLAQQEQDLRALNERLTGEFAAEQAKYNDEMRDSIQAFLKVYNKAKKYDYIISKAGDNILVANPKYDITKDVVKGLNKRYKIKPEVAEKIGAKAED
ncbi:MAG: OmpH family outer membrane protein [Clostridium sp.]|nr:OmpH family outer membrane protein [Clostridium sp.]